MKMIKKLSAFSTTLCASLTLFTANVLAADIGENVGRWATQQLFWIAVVALVIALVGAALKRNFVGAGITILFGGVLLFFIANPERIADLGDNIANMIGL